jgi:hypothetical protein
MNEDLRDWFGKGGKGGVGGGGWDRYNSSGDRVGKCGDAKEGDAYSACLSKEKARKLGKAGRAAFVKRKRAAQKKGGDAKKGGERSKGQKPIKVKTGVNEIDYHSKASRGHKPDWYQLHTTKFKPFDKSRDDMYENFSDGKNPGRKGLSKRVGVSQKMSIAQLEKIAKTATGERRRMAQWNLNMKRTRMKEEYSKELNERIKIIVRDVINKMVRGGFGPRTPVQMRDEIKAKLAAVIKPILNKYDYITENESDSLKEEQINNLKVYHSTDDKFEDFSLDYTWDGFWFTDNIDALKNKEAGASGGKYIMTRYITLNKPAGWDEYDKYSVGELIKMGYDGVILPEDNRIDYLVFNSDSISKTLKETDNPHSG